MRYSGSCSFSEQTTLLGSEDFSFECLWPKEVILGHYHGVTDNLVQREFDYHSQSLKK